MNIGTRRGSIDFKQSYFGEVLQFLDTATVSIDFHSDYSGNDKGDSGQFSTPGHLETYDTTLKLSFLDINIEQHSDCAEDSPLIGRYCGFHLPSDIHSTSNKLFVRFNSDHDVEYTGFRAAAFETGKSGHAITSISNI
ncbi:Cubilinlike [Caligus rogercresseyi]|uniref:Cubilinlike n=1 Tax=Caligus rogercresseyi TaxID=217165 RepID=A0A7T8GR39_CALRO|nr:Cubilinlike [Caligus rogercresseyi]